MWPFSKHKSKYENGYALGVLAAAHGKDKVNELKGFIDTAREFGDFDDFDRGAEQALKDKGVLYDA